MAFQSSLGIDIGDSALRVVYLKSALREIRVSAHAVYPIDRTMTLEEGLKAAAENLKAFIGKNRVTADNVFMGIPRRLAIVREMALPYAAKENLREVIGYEMEKYVPFSVDDVYFDYQVIEESKPENRINILLALVKKEAMSPYMELGGLLGTGVSGIEIPSTALTNYMFQGENVKGGGWVILCRTDDALELDVIRRNRLVYSRILAAADDPERLRETVRGEFKTIRTLMGAREDPVRAIVCGSESGDGWLRIFEEEGTPDVARVDLSKTGLVSQSLIPAYGLALKGLEMPAVDINLLPPEHRRKASRAGYYVMVGLLLLLLVSAVVWGGGSVARERFYINRLNQEIASLEPSVATIRRAQQRNAAQDKQIDYLNGIREGRSPLLDILKDLSEIIPKSAWISSFSYSEKGVELEGYADSASELIPLLEGSPHFKDAVFRSAITKSREGKERFKIGLQVN